MLEAGYMKLCEFVNECLIKYGCSKVFGVPGSLIMPIWQSITESNLILCSHEQEASYVATGFGKAKKGLSVVISIGGPGVTNCVSGLASANIDSIPLLYISGRTPLDKDGCGVRQEESIYNRKYDSTDVTRFLSKKVICVETVDKASASIVEAFETALSGRFGCVHLSIPLDLQKADIPVTYNLLQRNDAQEVILPVKFSDRPIIIIGWGAWMSNSVEKIYKLAELINAPILVTSKAYCCIQCDHPLYLGKLGYGYTDLLDDFICKYNPNQFLVFGSSLGEKDLSETMIERIRNNLVFVWTVEDDCIHRRFPNAVIIETRDMAQRIQRMFSLIAARRRDERLYSLVLDRKELINRYWLERISPTDSMAQAIKSICDLSGEVVITADAGNHLLNLSALFNPDKIGKLFIDVGIRSMGSGICSTVGMAFYNPNNTYIAITGDGCMLMNGNVMHLVYEYNLPVVFVVINNNSLGRVRVGQSIMNDYRATDIYGIDFQMYAKAFGLNSYKIENEAELGYCITSVVAKHQPAVIEIITDHDEIPVTLKDHIY